MIAIIAVLALIMPQAAPAPPRPVISRISFAWNQHPMPEHTLYLRFGSVSGGPYTNTIIVTGRTNYTLAYTNWSERYVAHYFILEMPNVGFSREIFWPRTPDRMEITCAVPVMVQESDGSTNWVDLSRTPITVNINQRFRSYRGVGATNALLGRAYISR